MVWLILKYLFLHNFSKTQHVMSSLTSKIFTRAFTTSLVSYLIVFPRIFTHGLCLSIPIWDDFAKMIFLVCCFDPATLSFFNLPIALPLLHHPWAICPQVLTKYQYPDFFFYFFLSFNHKGHCSGFAALCKFFENSSKSSGPPNHICCLSVTVSWLT